MIPAPARVAPPATARPCEWLIRERKDQAPGAGWSRAGRASRGNREWTGSTLGVLRLLARPGTGTKEQPKVESESARLQLLDLRLSNVCRELGETEAIQKEVISSCGLEPPRVHSRLPRHRLECTGHPATAVRAGGGGGGGMGGAVSFLLYPRLLTGLDQAKPTVQFVPLLASSIPWLPLLGVLPSVLGGGGR